MNRNDWTHNLHFTFVFCVFLIVSVVYPLANLIFAVFQLKLFFVNKSSELGIASRTIKQSIEHGEANVQWMERNFDKIVHWLSRQEKGS